MRSMRNCEVIERLAVLNEISKQMEKESLDKTSIFGRITRQCKPDQREKRSKCLAFCSESNRLFCVICGLFGKTNVALASDGYIMQNYAATNIHIKQHENSAAHQTAYASYMRYQMSHPGDDPSAKLIADNIFEIMNERIDEHDTAEQFSKEEIRKNRHVMERVIMCILFLVTNGALF